MLNSVDYALTDKVEIGLSATIPIGIYAVFPRARWTHSFSDKVHLGLTATAGVVGSYFEGEPEPILIYGGGPVLTVGDEKLFVNISLLAGAVTHYRREWTYEAPASNSPGANRVEVKELISETNWGMLPHVGVSWRFLSNVRANLEVVTLLGDTEKNGRLWAILYGVRIFGDRLYGDVSFMIPIPSSSSSCEFDVLGVGLPLLSLGYQFP